MGLALVLEQLDLAVAVCTSSQECHTGAEWESLHVAPSGNIPGEKFIPGLWGAAGSGALVRESPRPGINNDQPWFPQWVSDSILNSLCSSIPKNRIHCSQIQGISALGFLSILSLGFLCVLLLGFCVFYLWDFVCFTFGVLCVLPLGFRVLYLLVRAVLPRQPQHLPNHQ